MHDTCPSQFHSHSDLLAALDFVGRKGSVLLFGVACLRRVWARLDNEAHCEAVDATEAFARFRVGPTSLLEAWTRAEQSSGCGLWVASPRALWELWYEDVPAEGGGLGTHSLAGAQLRSPHQFAAKAALRARTLAADEALEMAAQRLLYSDIIGPAFWVPEEMGEARQDRAVREVIAGLDRERELDQVGVLAL